MGHIQGGAEALAVTSAKRLEPGCADHEESATPTAPRARAGVLVPVAAARSRRARVRGAVQTMKNARRIERLAKGGPRRDQRVAEAFAEFIAVETQRWGKWRRIRATVD